MTGEGISLREFIERLLNDHAVAHKEHQAAHDREHVAAQKAIDTASELARANKADANEWRATMTDRERTFARSESVEHLRDRVVDLERSNARIQGALAIARFLGAGALTVSGALLVWVITRT